MSRMEALQSLRMVSKAVSFQQDTSGDTVELQGSTLNYLVGEEHPIGVGNAKPHQRKRKKKRKGKTMEVLQDVSVSG